MGLLGIAGERRLPQSETGGQGAADPQALAAVTFLAFPGGSRSVLNVSRRGGGQFERQERFQGEYRMQNLKRLATTFGLLLPLAFPGQPAFAEDTLKIAIGQINNWENQAPTLGQEAGIFKKHDLVIEATGTQGAGETIQPVIAGSADLGAGVGAAAVMRAFSKGAPVRILAPMFTGTGDLYWYVKSDSKIQSIKDWTPETTVAYSTSGSTSNNIVVPFLTELGAKGKPTATGGPPATLTAGMFGPGAAGWG